MKIAIVYDAIYPYVKGGVEKRIYEVAKKLKNHEVHLFGVKFWKGKDLIKKNGTYYHGVCEFKNFYINGKRSLIQPIYFSIKLFKSLFKYKFDLIECQNFPYFPYFPVYLYSKLKKVPIIVIWHEFWENYWYKYLGTKGFFGLIIEKIVSKLSNYNICVSNLTKKRLNDKNAFVVPIGIDFENIKKFKKNKNNFDVVYVGRLVKEKNLEYLVRIKNIKIAIIGDGPKKEYLESISGKNVRFFRNVKEVYSYVKSSKIFVLPSYREGFGLAVLEAMACGLPIILVKSKYNAAVELIKGNGTISDINTLEYNINKLLKNKNLREKMGKKSIEIAKRYDWKMVIKILEGAYVNARKHFLGYYGQ